MTVYCPLPSVVVPLFAVETAVMVTVPDPMYFTTPPFVTAATFLSLDFHVTFTLSKVPCFVAESVMGPSPKPTAAFFERAGG